MSFIFKNMINEFGIKIKIKAELVPILKTL